MPGAFHQFRPVLATPPKQTGKLFRERCYCLRVRTEGYGKALAHRVLASRQPDVWQDVEVGGPAVDEYCGSHAVQGFGARRGALKLPVEETTKPPLPPASEWVSVTRFRDPKAGDDWGPAAQAAIASGPRVVYFPKTEYESQKLLAEAGAATEILGAFIYPLGKIPAERPIFENRNSRIALVDGTSVYHANHQLHILDVRGIESRTVGNEALQWAGSRARMDLYTSDASQP